ncbi:uncharacterized protein FIBRA_07224 [Fibroporia radiculosa]|uniref:Uncharacterized protein n=1 Tax=Fibroporia radiculosa TaxID=599839 RepID=J4H4H9_9APHY|nr:uncharacterized protein FIBRA_07224 [Fibroporia radiculosa]CCM05024.1 predicted protein [Fibroporia radiculosa]
MQLWSSGLRALKPTGGGAILHHPQPSHVRSIHVSSFVPRPHVGQGTSTTQTIFKQTRTLLSRFITHLTAPGTLRSPQNFPASARSLYNGPTQMRTIQQGLSLPARHALSRPLQAPHLPRAPSVPRGVSQVGLGLARNFSTGRPVFQNLVENVPVAGRAFWEADWELKMNKERERLRMQKESKKNSKKASKEMSKPRREAKPLAATVEEERKAEMDHYFPNVIDSEVTTHLLIPLAPTPASRIPLPVSPQVSPSSHPLLPFPLLSSLHSAHSTQTLRISSLFSRLDAAHVFQDPGVHCEAHGDPSGLCTLLEVTFEGWDEARVRSVLGEAGRGWCVIDEVRKDKEREDRERMEDVLEAMSMDSEVSWGDSLEDAQGLTVDPSHSLVLPTLDFSASFPLPPRVSSPSIATPLSDLEFHNAWTSMESVSHGESAHRLNSAGSELESSWVGSDMGVAQPDVNSEWSRGSDSSWCGFSSSFTARMNDADRPATRVL